jgi:predicted nucleotide-binding protein (sugar kinase/HSP70/actin superfamily)
MLGSVGIPQGLLYYKYGPAWATFFERLGYSVILSPSTNRTILARGVELGENELCLPVKLYFGHVAALDGKVDYIFVPRIVSVDRHEYTCPKLLGLPDITKIHGFTSELLAPTFNLRLGRKRLLQECYRFGRTLSDEPVRVAAAVAGAFAELYAHEKRLRSGELLQLEPLPEPPPGAVVERPLRIGVAGHAYNVYDPITSQGLLRRLNARGAEVITSDMVSPRDVDRAVADLPKALFWTYEKELVGAVRHWIKNDMVDGVIQMLSFSCGPDSFIQVLIEDSVRELSHAENGEKVPLMPLVIDEHTGEAGMVTRIDAFMDMLARKPRVGTVARAEAAVGTTPGAAA